MNNNEKEFYDIEENENKEEIVEEYAYKNVITKKGNTRLFSLISVCLAALSVIVFLIPWLGLIFGLLSIGFSFISRRKLGYFEGLALVGLIIGIFGFVFSLTGIILGAVTSDSGYYNFWELLFGGFLI